MMIVLIGYMGSGKSTVGRVFAQKLDTTFTDLDERIENESNTTISELFKTHGTIHFRKLESKVLRDFVENNSEGVLALGGGTPCYANNMDFLNASKVITIYLKLSIPELVKRLRSQKAHRPLIQNISDAELPEFIGKHLFERSPFYNQAQYTINCNYKTVEEVVLELENLLRQVD
ncbi:shikimate kinase [Croceivirga lutea]|uniref:shikimate kinase n=1 Tax=Croceivirga lutea TaxID=1775167 RepID=UPI001639D092|nr:shikimate kinase [Croceivirga lutea]